MLVDGGPFVTVNILLGFYFSVFVLLCGVWPNLCLKEQVSIKTPTLY